MSPSKRPKLLSLISRKTIIQANWACIWCFWVKHIILGHKNLKKFNADSNLKICHLPGLEAQKVENN